MRVATREEHASQVRAVVDLVQTELSRRLSLEEMADHAGFSPFHFQRLFRTMTGETPTDLVRRFRLERGAQQLAATEDLIGDIAFDAEYDSHEAFSRAFRTAFGVTPRTFRQENLSASWLASPVGLHFGCGSEFMPLNHKQPVVDYSIEEVSPFLFAGLQHQGSFQFAHRTWGRLFEGLAEAHINPMPHRWINMADELNEAIPISEIQGLVGMDLEPDQTQDWMVQRTLGGGPHLVARLVGPGNGLVDFWYRLFFECLPHRAMQLRRGPLFQASPGVEAVGSPNAFTTVVHIPVEPR